MPAIFFGHGNPMNALATNPYTAGWTHIGQSIPRPRAILCISAHWYINRTGVTISTAPRTIHDFGGFPQELYQVLYPAPGSPELARRVQALLSPLPVQFDETWGLDHGTWSVLTHVYPAAEIPVVQLSLDAREPPAFHYELGRRLAPLREEGILIMGSGNLVHNLRLMDWSAGAAPYDWATRFDQEVREMIQDSVHEPLLAYAKLGPDAQRSIPTPEHFLPLLHILGARQASDPASFPVEGIDAGSVSMLTLQLG